MKPPQINIVTWGDYIFFIIALTIVNLIFNHINITLK